MSPGLAFQLLAVIAQQIGKIGLGFDQAKLLVDKPSITRRRLEALCGEKTSLIVPNHQYATLERLEVDPNGYHRDDPCGEYLVTVGKEIEEALAASNSLTRKYGNREKPASVHRCDVVHSVSEKDGALYPVFREVMRYHGADDYLWETLHERRALWTTNAVLGILSDEIHDGNDPLGLTEINEEAVFPVLLTEKENMCERFKRSPDRVGALFVSRRAPIRQKRGWSVSLVESRNIPQFLRNLIYFANDPGPCVES